LVAAIGVNEVRLAVDLGCGPGNSTEVLAPRFSGAKIHGLDNSPEMISAARERLPRADFKLAAVQDWAFTHAEPPTAEVILANVVLRWAPRHEALFPAVAGRLAAHGALAIQMPDNLDQPSHVAMRDTARDGPWRESLIEAAVARATLASAD